MKLLYELITAAAERSPAHPALRKGSVDVSFSELDGMVARTAAGLASIGLGRRDRVAVYLPKQVEAVAAMFAAVRAGGIFVPVNPVLKPTQVAHILRDSGARVLVTSMSRAEALATALVDCAALDHVVVVDDGELPARGVAWQALLDADATTPARLIDTDPAAILYTSGSTGRPKGVVLSHRNLVCGAESVASYLRNDASDRILAVLPLSFDYGFSQITTSFLVGATAVLMDYLVPRDVLRAVDRHGITGLAAVPPLWIQLAELPWPPTAVERLRYITNSGGALPARVVAKLRACLLQTSVYLMYGLTEAFRSTYLPPDDLDERPTSMGKAIPNAEVLVVRPDGTRCDPGEPGELVHRGALVSLGYWNDPDRTAERFRPVPPETGELPIPETSVWSGDTVVRDEQGYLYFVGRRDEQIKTSGYRVSPTEIEEIVFGAGLVTEAVAVGVPHPSLGQAIVLFAVARTGSDANAALLDHCRRELPPFMVPAQIEWRAELPRNANGKIDRKVLADDVGDLFVASAEAAIDV